MSIRSDNTRQATAARMTTDLLRPLERTSWRFYLLVLFLGNVGVGTSYWGTLPLGILVSSLLAGSSATRSYR